MKTAQLPIIDLNGFSNDGGPIADRIAKATVKACETEGFFYVTNHGIPGRFFEDAKCSALDFFRQPPEYKSEVHISRFSHHRGYIGNYEATADLEKGGDIREAYKIALELPDNDPDYLAGITLYGPNVWPKDMVNFEKRIYRVYDAFLNLSTKIFSLFAMGLNLDADYFVPLCEKPASVMNVNYYSGLNPDNGESSGIGAHCDYEAFAMLWQDNIGGLQIMSLDGEWQVVPPVEGALVINIGDLMQHWTNNRFRATLHRVINISEEERVSIAFFGNTNYHTIIECLPTCCSIDNPPLFPPKTAGEYLMDTIKRTYSYAKS